MKKVCKQGPPDVIIPAEQALFWMDGQGRWHNQHGPFEHKKIIDHFNASIRKDDQGYYLGQHHGGVYEKVYFRCQETALFVTDLIGEDPVQMLINTGDRMDLSPGMLFIRNDQLYHRKGDEIVKFSQNALVTISRMIEFSAGGCTIRLQGKKYAIQNDHPPDQGIQARGSDNL